MANVLILSKSFEAPGGVVNFIRSVIARMPAEVNAIHLPIGSRPGRESGWESWLAPLIDNWRLARSVLRLKPRCVHINPSFNWASLCRDGLFVLTLKALRYRHVLVYFHGWSSDQAAQVQRSRVLTWLFGAVFGGVPVVCVLASAFKRSLVAMGLDPDKVHVLTTMYDEALFEGMRPSRSDGAPTALYLGRLVEGKGAGDVLEAYACLQRRLPEAKLVIAGDGPELKRLTARAAELGLADRVAFPGYITGERKAQALLDADVYVFPTRYGEGCPVSLLEAMAAGLPVVTTRAGGIADILEDGVNGTVADGFTAGTLAGAMEQALTDRAWARACGCRNRSQAASSYASSVVTAGLVELYDAAARR